MKTLIVQQTKHQLRHKICRGVNFFNSRSWMGPINDENKLTKRTKTGKFEKALKIYIIIFKTICCKLTVSCDISQSILNYKLMRLVSILRLPREKKTGKTANSKKR